MMLNNLFTKGDINIQIPNVVLNIVTQPKVNKWDHEERQI